MARQVETDAKVVVLRSDRSKYVFLKSMIVGFRVQEFQGWTTRVYLNNGREVDIAGNHSKELTEVLQGGKDGRRS